MEAGNFIARIEDVKTFISSAFVAVNTSKDHADLMAELLTSADRRGHYSHGLNRLHMCLDEFVNKQIQYLLDRQSNMTKDSGQPKILKETPAIAFVDGCDLLGPVVGQFCMEKAIEMAGSIGMGFVVCRGSTHFGICSYYAQLAVDRGMIGMSFTNGSRIVFPTRARQSLFATNPICMGAPGQKGDSFMLDMATSVVAVGKCEINARREEKIPAGWGVDAQGKETLDPNQVLDGGGVMPLGGLEETSGYKGFGLGFMVEILCAILTGANAGPEVREWMTRDRPANIGHCFMAIDPKFFADDFSGRLQQFLDLTRQLDPVDSGKPVLVPGDPEREREKACDERGGILYHRNQIAYAQDLAKTFGVEMFSFTAAE